MGISTTPVTYRIRLFVYKKSMGKNKLIYDSSSRRIKGSKNPDHDVVIRTFSRKYNEKYGIIPEIGYGSTCKLINLRLKNHSPKGLAKIIEMFFDEESGDKLVFDIKVILSSFFMNKYSPKLRLDPKVYANAGEWNKEVY